MPSTRQGSAVSPLSSESLIPLASQASIREVAKGLGTLLPRGKQRENEKPHYVLYFLIAQNLTQRRWTQFSSSRNLRTTYLQAFAKLSSLPRRTPPPQLPPASTNVTRQIPLSQQDLQACQSPFWTLPGLRNKQALHFLVLAALT